MILSRCTDKKDVIKGKHSMRMQHKNINVEDIVVEEM
jgi:hypothetical protein